MGVGDWSGCEAGDVDAVIAHQFGDGLGTLGIAAGVHMDVRGFVFVFRAQRDFVVRRAVCLPQQSQVGFVGRGAAFVRYAESPARALWQRAQYQVTTEVRLDRVWCRHGVIVAGSR